MPSVDATLTHRLRILVWEFNLARVTRRCDLRRSVTPLRLIGSKLRILRLVIDVALFLLEVAVVVVRLMSGDPIVIKITII
jgi:hypothetical protein